VGTNNDGVTGQQYILGYDTVMGANVSRAVRKEQNPYYGYADDSLFAGTPSGMNHTIYGGGAGASGSNAGGGGHSMWGGNGGGCKQNDAVTGNGAFPGGGGGSNDIDQGSGGDGGDGIVVVYTKRTTL
jgi:hypothetical protein